jgi:PPM family protein phosphatase
MEVPGVVHAGLTDVGLVRERNEDAWGMATAEADGARVFVVADGMGGHAAGQIASQLAVQRVEEAFRLSRGALSERLREAVRSANRRVHEEALRDAALAGMGTTLVALGLDAGGACVANVGDSRAYRLRAADFVALTRDHSLVEELVRRGLLAPEQARFHPRRNELTRSLGTGADVEVDLEAVEVARGDVFLLCSDGLCGVVEDRGIAALLDSRSPDQAARALVDAAIGQGGPDNVTVLVLQIT